jgi:hypothetical protein
MQLAPVLVACPAAGAEGKPAGEVAARSNIIMALDIETLL